MLGSDPSCVTWGQSLSLSGPSVIIFEMQPSACLKGACRARVLSAHPGLGPELGLTASGRGGEGFRRQDWHVRCLAHPSVSLFVVQRTHVTISSRVRQARPDGLFLS